MITIPELLDHINEHHPGTMSLVPFNGLIRRVRVRRNHDGIQYGLIIADIPVSVARNLQRPVDDRDLLVLIHVPREVANDSYRALESNIITPTIIVP